MTFGTDPSRIRLPVWETVAESYRQTFRHLPTLVKFTWVWMLLLVIVDAMFAWLTWHFIDDKAYRAGLPEYAQSLAVWSLTLVSLIIDLAIYAIILVPWHRLLLLNERTNISTFAWTGNRVRNYFGFGLLMLIFAEIPDAIGFLHTYLSKGIAYSGIVDQIGWMAFLFVLYTYVVTRLSLALPGLALGHDSRPLNRAWNATIGNFWRLGAGSILSCGLAILALVGADYGLMKLADMDYLKMSRMQTTVLATLASVIGLFAGMSYVTFLSLAYRHFFGPFEQQA